MELDQILADIYRKEIKIVIDREIKEPEFLHADYFVDNYDRANAGNKIAMEQVNYFAALICSKHSQVAKGEPLEQEIKENELALREEYMPLWRKVEAAIVSKEAQWWLIP